MKAEEEEHRDVILIVDDNPTNLRFLQEILKEHYKVYAAPSGERALMFLERKTPDLILLDVEMPGLNGYEVIARLKQDYRWDSIPVIFLTAQEGRDKEQHAFELGAVDYILKPISAGVVKSRVGLHIELENYKKNLEQLVEDKTSQLQKTQNSILDILSNVTAYRDNETGAHIKRTTYFTEQLVIAMREQAHPRYTVSDDYAANIVKSSKLHDIGKVAVPDGILLKPGRLSDEEFEIIKKHTTLGAEILNDAIQSLGDTTSFLTVAHEIVLSHHERWDGTGYPQGLKEKEIPISARIMAIADVYDALISERPYKNAFTHEQSMEMIMDSAGSHFDPVLLELCTDAFRLFPKIADEYKDENYRMAILQAMERRTR